VAYAGKVVGPGLRDGRRRRHSNPAAETDPGSPIYGMPILKVNHSRSVIVLKRSMSFGFAGIDNDLYYDPKTTMLLGDAKSSVGEIVEELMAL
jgi:NAD(P) transhydrogenase subunit beta